MISFKAKVIRGSGRGRRLGFPTANIVKPASELAYGVYSVAVKYNGRVYQGLMHFGPRKTFKAGIGAEIYIKDFKGSLYGRELEIKILRKIRETRKFKDAAALIKQIKKDLRELSRVISR